MKEVAIKDICKKDSSALKQKELLPEGKYPVFGASGIAGYLDRYHQKKEYIGIVKDGSGIGRVAFYPAESSLIGTMQYVLPKENYDIRYIGYCLQSLDLSKYKQGAAIPHIYFRDYGEQLVKVTDNWEEQHSIVSRLDSAFSHIDALKANAEKQLNEARKLFQAELTECMKPKEGWEEKKLGEVCDFEGGSQPPKSEWINHPQDGYVRMLQIRDFTRSRNAEIEYVKISKKIRLCKADDILIGRYGASVGKILTGLAGAYNVAIIKSIPNEELISKAFIKRYFEARSFQSVLFKVCASRAAQAGFSKDDICDTPIPVPPLSEQHRIVSHLDSLSSTIRKLEELQQKTIAECDALKQAMLREVFE